MLTVISSYVKNFISSFKDGDDCDRLNSYMTFGLFLLLAAAVGSKQLVGKSPEKKLHKNQMF